MRIPRQIAERPELVPGILGTGVFVAWTVAEGGATVTTLTPGTLFLVGLALMTAIAWRPRSWIPRAILLALAAFALWSALSIAWTESEASTWESANRAIAYLAVVTVFALPAWSGAGAAIVLGSHSFAFAAVALGTLISIATASDPQLEFIDGRLAEPTGYQNATAAVFLLAAFPALFLATDRSTPWALRPAFLGVSGILVEIAVLPQSRGVAIAAIVGAIAFIALAPSRTRALAALAPVVTACALAGPTLLGTLEDMRQGGGAATDAADSALLAVLASALALTAVGAVLVAVDKLVGNRRPTARTVEGAVRVGLVCGAAVAVIGALIAIGSPISWAEDRWNDFRGGYGEEELTSSNRFTAGLGTNRYDFWRVAFEEFRDRPLTGGGAGSFAIVYLEKRDSLDEPRWAHSLPLELLAETGLVGTLLVGVALLVAAIGALQARLRADDRLARGVAAVSLTAIAAWAVAAGVDWMWQVPAVTAPALAWLVMAARLADQAPAPLERSVSRPLVIAGGGAIALALAASLALPWFAALRVEQASALWRSDPGAAFAALEDARRWNPLSSEPDTLAGAIALRRGQLELAREHFAAALERDRHQWYAALQLAALSAQAGDRARAFAYLADARAANPGEPLIERTRKRVAGGRPVSFKWIDKVLADRVCMRLGRTEATKFCG